MLKKIFHFVFGLMLIIVLFTVIAFSPVPETGATTIAHQNLKNDYDATPLFYSEVDKYLELEEGLTKSLEEAQNK